MSNNGEIKVNYQSFDIAIYNVAQSGKLLYDEFQKIHQINVKMKEKWQGDGGAAFNLCAMVVEAQFTRIIEDIVQKIDDLTATKELTNQEDNELANQMIVYHAD